MKLTHGLAVRMPAGLDPTEQMGEVVTFLHLQAPGQYALSFPEYAPKQRGAPFGMELQVFGEQSVLELLARALVERSQGLAQPFKVSALFEVGAPTRWLEVLPSRPPKSPEKVAARLHAHLARQGKALDTPIRVIARKPQGHLPYLKLRSMSTGARYAKHVRVLTTLGPGNGRFDVYGFSKGGAVPVFAPVICN